MVLNSHFEIIPFINPFKHSVFDFSDKLIQNTLNKIFSLLEIKLYFFNLP